MKTNERCWIRIKDITPIYGLKRTSLYKLLNSREIESKLISPKIRLVSVQSIEDFINSK